MKLMHRPKYLVVLEVLELGIEVEIADNTFAMGMDALGKRKIIGVPYAGYIYETEMTLSTFISICEKLTQDQIVELCTDIALNKIRQEDAEKRRAT